MRAVTTSGRPRTIGYPQGCLQRKWVWRSYTRCMANIPLRFPPKSGDIVMCEFPECFAVPEMVKTRAVVVISRRAQHALGMATVVPLSSTEPDEIRDHHCLIPQRLLPKFMQATGAGRWIKGDMVYTFSIKRLSLPQAKRDRATGKRVYDTAKLDLEHLVMVRRCVASALSIDLGVLAENQSLTPASQSIAAVSRGVKAA